MTTLSPSDLADVLALEYAGAVPTPQVLSTVAQADRALPRMDSFPATRADLLEAQARRMLVERVLRPGRPDPVGERATSPSARTLQPWVLAS